MESSIRERLFMVEGIRDEQSKDIKKLQAEIDRLESENEKFKAYYASAKKQNKKLTELVRDLEKSNSEIRHSIKYAVVSGLRLKIEKLEEIIRGLK